MKKEFEILLKQADLRSLGKSNRVMAMIDDQLKFDELFTLVFHADRKIAMRAADIIEKITRTNFYYLVSHKYELLKLIRISKFPALKWHLSLIVSRMQLNIKEFGIVWDILTAWATNNKESKIVRVNAIQAMHDLLLQQPELRDDFANTLSLIKKEQIPSINARIKKFNIL